MLAEERRQRVLDLVSERGFVALADLAKTVSASESTIRRDLDYWDSQGALKRTHGGAIYVGDAQPMPALEDRASNQLTAKKAIAHAAVARIRDGDTILLDGGTTTLEIARLLVGRSIQIVTNSLPIANLYAGTRETDLIMLGGYVFPRTGVALGPLTRGMMENLHVHQTILSVSGVTQQGLFNSNLLLVETERQMMKCADEVIVVADHSKLGRSALAFLCPLNEVDTVILDQRPTGAAAGWMESADVRLIIAGEKEEFQQ